MKKVYRVKYLLSFVMVLTLLLSSGGAYASDVETSKKGASTSKTRVFPVKFKEGNRKYTITGYSLGKNDAGNTKITIYGDNLVKSTFSGMNARNIDTSKLLLFKSPARCEFEASEKLHIPTYSSFGDSWVYEFNTSLMPENIILKSGETGKVIVFFNVKDVEDFVINKQDPKKENKHELK